MNHWGKKDRNREYQDSNDSASTPVLQRMAYMEMDWNLTKLSQPFQVLMTNQQKSPKRSYDG